MLRNAIGRVSRSAFKGMPAMTRFSTVSGEAKNTTQTFDYSKKNEGESTNIVWSEGLFTKEEREKLTGRKGCTIWITGLSGSGKSTVACALEEAILTRTNGANAYRLDGDNVRFGLNKDLGFSEKDRGENIRRIGEVAKLFADSGCITITAFVSPYIKDRDIARKMHEDAGIPFLECVTQVPLEVAEARDPKGLYKKARAGEIKGFTGIDDPYEAPVNPEMIVHTDKYDVAECVEQMMADLEKRGLLEVAK